VTVHFQIEMQGWFDALDAITGPGDATVAALTAVMEAGFKETQALVHVITGSLKNSGRVVFERSDAEWSGEIIYGGASPGFPNDPVDYASAEFGRGGLHDALKNTDLMHHDLLKAMYASMEAGMAE
jgi:hypothetical protein